MKAETEFSDDKVSWKKPSDKITLQWHDGESYNGIDGTLKDPEGTVTLYAAAKFEPEDLKPYAGTALDSVMYFEYRDVYRVNVLIYEDGVVVRDEEADLSGFEKNSWRTVKLTNPYIIPDGKDVMFAIKYESGRNMTFVANCDRTPTRGKGNLYSYDGKKWHTDGPGDFLITACLHNNATDNPDGYYVYRDGEKVSEDLVQDLSYTLKNETDGHHSYYVSAVYGDNQINSVTVDADPLSVYNQLPPISSLSGHSDNLSGTIGWTSPLKRGVEMTWSNKTFNQAIGGTSSSNAKVWIKQEFSNADLAAFPNHRITAINAYVGAEGGITGATLFVIKNGSIDYSEDVSSDAVAAITTGGWNKFALSTPYVLALGNDYAFGIYYTHTPKMHPVGVDNSDGIEEKGNSFSTSSPSSKGFNETKPSWKTLSSGKITGNFMLTADVEAMSDEAAKPQNVASYDIYRDGKEIAADVKALTYTDNVDDLGTYVYSVVAKSEYGKTSPKTDIIIDYTLPEKYVAPTIIDYDQSGKDVSFSWSSDAYEMKHYGTASYMVGFDEDMSILYGAKFSKEELADYAGYDFHSLKFGIGETLDKFKIQVYTSDKELLYSKEYVKGDIEPGYIYVSTLSDDDKFKIPADKDLYVVYNAVLPGGTNPILLDAGPAVDGGAVISLTGGESWMKLGTISPTISNYNIVISALATAPAGETAAGKQTALLLSSVPVNGSRLQPLESSITTQLHDYELQDDGISATKALKANESKAAEKPKVKSFNVYRNGELVKEGSETSYSETLGAYGIFDYYVTSVYENGWESPASPALTFSNTIAQKTQAPYNLTGSVSDEGLRLEWESPSEAPELTYQNGDADNVFGMTTSSSEVEGYSVVKFNAGEISDKIGQDVSHVKFKLADNNLTYASVVVMYGDNIVYEQELNPEEIVKGWNNVRLNKAVPVASGRDLGVGYHLKYKNGVKPIVFDGGPAVSGQGDLISSSATPGYWYSFKTKFGYDYNWRISATLKTADNEISPKAAKASETGITYNVYRDGNILLTGITSTNCIIADAAEGNYTVTAVTSATGESAESNSVRFAGTSGLSMVEVDESAAPIYSIDGRIINKNGDIRNLRKGVYIKGGKKFVIK